MSSSSSSAGELTYQDQQIDSRAIRRTALPTVEGERDDICSMGQTAARTNCAPGSGPT